MVVRNNSGNQVAKNQQHKRKEEKRIVKNMIKDLFAMLDRYSDAIIEGSCRTDSMVGNNNNGRNNNGTIHLWTTIESSSTMLLPCSNDYGGVSSTTSTLGQEEESSMLQQHHRKSAALAKKRNRNRSQSCSIGSLNDVAEQWNNNSSSSSSKKGSDKRKSGSKNKSLRPRSHSDAVLCTSKATEVADDEERNCGEHQVPNILRRLCRSHFFTGKCNYKNKTTGAKKGAVCCNCYHYSEPYKTLASVLSAKHSSSYNKMTATKLGNKKSIFVGGREVNSKNDDIQLSKEACYAATPVEMKLVEPKAMEILYYSSLGLRCSEGANNNKNNHGDSDNDTDDSQQETRPKLISERIRNRLLSSTESRGNSACTNIIYLALNDVLLFDRHRGGFLEHNFENYLQTIGSSYERKARTRRASSASTMSMSTTFTDSSSSTDDEWDDLVALPGIILDHILLYLPDVAVFSASLVCRAWYLEIGRTSPNLWRQLLMRRSWPIALPEQQQQFQWQQHKIQQQHQNQLQDNNSKSLLGSISSCNGNENFMVRYLRDQFITHYQVMRDVKAIRLGITALAHNDNNSDSDNESNSVAARGKTEMTFRSFAKTRGAPQFPNCCVAMQVWAPNQVLAAYTHDCTLRLFEARSSSSNDNGNISTSSNKDISCRESLCISVDPYKHTKKKSCRLVSMELDDTYIASLCHVLDEKSWNHESFQLVIISRDDYLVEGDRYGRVDRSVKESIQKKECFTLIDVGESILNYLFSCDDIDHNFLRDHNFSLLRNYFDMGGDLADVEIIASQSFAACGHGQFMVEVAISIPVERQNFDDDDDDEFQQYHPSITMTLIDRRLFMFSSAVGAIVWMGESTPPIERMRPRHEDMTLVACSTNGSPAMNGLQLSRSSYNVAVASSSSPVVSTAGIDPFGTVVGTQLVQAYSSSSSSSPKSTILRNDILREALLSAWELHSMQQRPIVVTPSDIIMADNLVHNNAANVEGGDNDTRSNQKQCKSIITFYRRELSVGGGGDGANRSITRGQAKESNCHDCSYERLSIKGNCQVVRMVRFRDHHIVLLCRCYLAETEGEHRRNSNMVVFTAIVVHVPTRKEVDRVPLLNDSSCFVNFDGNPINISVTNNTIAATLLWKGVVLTGDDVRSLGRVRGEFKYQSSSIPSSLLLKNHVQFQSLSKKKQKQRKSTKGSRK